MRLTRVYVPGLPSGSAVIALPDAAAKHVARVLRLTVGDALRIFDGCGNEFDATLTTVMRDRVEVRIGDAVPNRAESPLRITLLQGVARGDKMDLILQKATELGVTAIRPLLSARSTVKLDAAGIAKRHAHWEGVIASSCEQCGRATLPSLAPTESLASVLASSTAELRLLLEPTQTAASLPALLETHAAAARQGVQLLIGPEGGFDDAEIKQALAAGFASCQLGPRVLRTETAGLAAIAALQVLAGDWR